MLWTEKSVSTMAEMGVPKDDLMGMKEYKSETKDKEETGAGDEEQYGDVKEEMTYGVTTNGTEAVKMDIDPDDKQKSTRQEDDSIRDQHRDGQRDRNSKF